MDCDDALLPLPTLLLAVLPLAIAPPPVPFDAKEKKQQADIANVLTFDEARRIAVNVAKLPELLGPTKD